MDHTYILPFVRSIKNVFTTMLQLEVRVGRPVVKEGPQGTHDVSGIIGMSGDVEGSVVLSFPLEVASRTVTKFVGMEFDSTSEDFADAIGELVNMISGGAKAEFTGKRVSISCPSVVVGNNHHVLGSKDVTYLIIPCSTDVGQFSVEVGLRMAK